MNTITKTSEFVLRGLYYCHDAQLRTLEDSYFAHSIACTSKLLLVTEGEVEVADIGVGVFTGRDIDLEDDAIAGGKTTGRWVGRTSSGLDLPATNSACRDGSG